VEWQSRESRIEDEPRTISKTSTRRPRAIRRYAPGIRNLQRQARRKKVKNDVSKAAVVLINPTHYAVALGFDFATMEAPKMLAKGRNLLAEEIKAEARWAGVPIIENPPLARSLYKSVEVGQPIRPISMRRWRRFWPISTNSGWRVRCVRRRPARQRHRRSLGLALVSPPNAGGVQ